MQKVSFVRTLLEEMVKLYFGQKDIPLSNVAQHAIEAACETERPRVLVFGSFAFCKLAVGEKGAREN